MSVEQASIFKYVVETFEGIETDTSTPTTFFFYDPDCMMPMVTIKTTDDEHDDASKLDRSPETFRLNVGVSKATFVRLFGELDDDAGVDYAAVDRLMPHPVYGGMHWVSVIDPSATTWEAVRPLLAEAYELAVKKYAKKKRARGQ